jgi:hypothetical protein
MNFQARRAEAGPNPPSSSLQQRETNTAWPDSSAGRRTMTNEEILANPTLAQSGVPQPIKLRLVELWAQFQTLSAISKAIKAEFGLTLDPRTICQYDGASRSCRMGKRLRLYFAEVRKEYIQRAADVAVAHQAHRLRKLEEVIEKAIASKDFNSALKGLELSAKEMGGVLEGKTTVRHEGAISHVHGTVEDARAEVAMRLQQLVDTTLVPPAEEDAPPTTVDSVATPLAIPHGTP